MLTAFATTTTTEAPTEEPVTSGQEEAPVDAIQLGPPIHLGPPADDSGSAAAAFASAARPKIPPLRLDLARLTSQNRREPVVAAAGTYLVTDSGATVRTLVGVVVPCATDAEPGSIDVPIEFVGKRPVGFESGSVVDVGQIDLVTAIMASLPATSAPRAQGAPPPESSPQPAWMQGTRNQGNG
jgi:hypothetical protein